MNEFSYGWWSLAPPVAAILLAIFTRRVVLSLLAGVLLGAVILAVGPALQKGEPLDAGAMLDIGAEAVIALAETHLWKNLVKEDHLRVFVFTSLMGAMVGVISRSGGMNGVVDLMAPLARSRRGFQLTTWALGLIVFFDDYANSLLLGSTMRPLADRLKVSREKLAYIVDSTAAPVSGLALISTWIAGEIGYINEGYAQVDLAGAPVDGFSVFLATIPYRFYVLWALLLVPLVAILGRDLWPMWGAEDQALRCADDAPQQSASAAEPASQEKTPRKASDAIVPVVVMIGATLALLLSTGFAATGFAATKEGEQSISWIMAFGNGNSYLALLYGSLAGLLTATTMAQLRGGLSAAEIRGAALEGAIHVLPALTILWLAWSLSAVTSNDFLATGKFLGGLLENAVAPPWMPTIVFVLASGVAFSTGTSWGTMGILMPLVVSVTFRMLALQSAPVDPYDPLLIATIGSVLAGAIFGDHCSPISDTTVLSSHASGCNHIEHVRTQMPYALLAAAISILAGTLPVGFGAGVWLLLPLGLAALVASLWALGRPLK